MDEMMVFIHPGCDNDDEMKVVMKKIQARMKRLCHKDHTSPDGAQVCQSKDKDKTKNLNARLKRLLAAKKKFKSTACSNVLHPNLDELMIASHGCDSSDSGCSDISGMVSAASHKWQSECEKCGNTNAGLPRKKKRKKPNCCPDVPEKRGRHEGLVPSSVPLPSQAWQRVAMDCEFVGVGPRKVSALGRCSVVDFAGNVILDIYARPNEPITDYRTRWSGLRKRDLVKAVPVESALNIIKKTLKDKLIIGHAVHNDFRVLGIHPPPHLIRDTAKCKLLQDLCIENGGKGTSLKAYSQHILGRSIQKREHCSVEDCRAALDLYRHIQSAWEAQLQPQSCPTEHPGPNPPHRHCEPSASGENSFLDDAYWVEVESMDT